MQISENLKQFIKMESAGGMVLSIAAVAALILSNTPFAAKYAALLSTPMVIGVGDFEINKPLVLWINDGLMAIFFFLIGLEIKREVLEGELSSWDQASLPFFAAIGGMAVPALVFVVVASGSPEALKGWAIPAATDIAFALGILALLGSRAPSALKIFLLAVAIIDDLGAILIIAVFYTENLSVTALIYALVGLAGLIMLNRLRVMSLTPYVLLGAFMWACVLKSGVHATLAGVLTALTVPMSASGDEAYSPLHKTEKSLHKWVAFLILPVFAFANAGVSFAGMTARDVFSPLTLGIVAGLAIGKPLGVFAASAAAVRLKVAVLPESVSWRLLAGAGCLTGVGFTMSLFIGGLAFDSAAEINAIRIGVISGSIVAGGLGVLIIANPQRFFDRLFPVGHPPALATQPSSEFQQNEKEKYEE